MPEPTTPEASNDSTADSSSSLTPATEAAPSVDSGDLPQPAPGPEPTPITPPTDGSPAPSAPPSPDSNPPRQRSTRKLLAIIAAVLILVAALGLAGYYVLNSSEETADNSTQTSPTPTPSVSLTPTPTQISQTVLFYDTRNGITMANNNGDNLVRIVDTGIVGYAGMTADKSAIYYTATNSDGQSATLYKRTISDKKDTKIVDFPAVIIGNDDPVSSSDDEYASVRPDGKYALLAAKSGVILYNLSDSSQKKILSNQSSSEDCGFSVKANSSWLSWLIKPAQAAIACTRYYHVQYSPDGSQALVKAFYYETGSTFLIDPTTGKTLKEWGAYQSVRMNSNWKSAAVSGTGTESPGVGLSYFASMASDPVDLFGSSDESRVAENMSWSADGKLFVSSKGKGDVVEVFTPPSTNTVLLDGELGSPESHITSSLWLSDNVHILYRQDRINYLVDTKADPASSSFGKRWSSEASEFISLIK